MHGANPHAVRHNGYTDGYFCYYKIGRNTWYAIHPETGLSVATENRLRDAYKSAWAANFPMFNVTPERLDAWKKRFEMAVSEIVASCN